MLDPVALRRPVSVGWVAESVHGERSVLATTSWPPGTFLAVSGGLCGLRFGQTSSRPRDI